MNTDLAGWSWIERTFAWAEPTALALLALESAGAGEHPRAREGSRSPARSPDRHRRLELRQRPRLRLASCGRRRSRPASCSRPSPDARRRRRSPRASPTSRPMRRALRTPLALGWACLAQNAWRARSATRDAGSAASAGIAGQRQVRAIRETLARESRYGSYDSAELALLAVAAVFAARTARGPAGVGVSRDWLVTRQPSRRELLAAGAIFTTGAIAARRLPARPAAAGLRGARRFVRGRPRTDPARRARRDRHHAGGGRRKADPAQAEPGRDRGRAPGISTPIRRWCAPRPGRCAAFGAAEVLVGEGPGHRRDTILVLEESGLAQVLRRREAALRRSQPPARLRRRQRRRAARASSG